MQKSLALALVATGLLTGSSVFAQEAAETGFNNFLLASPSIVSPSQNYQVKQGRFEGMLGLSNTKAEGKNDGPEIEAKETGLALGGFYALNPMIVLGIDLRYATGDVEGADYNSTELTPAIAWNVTPMFSLGLAAHIVSGEDDRPEPLTGSDKTSFTYATLGATVHSGMWEATLAFSSENDDDKKPQNNSAQAIAIHGRYKFMPALALGLSFKQSDNSGLEASTDDVKDEGALGLHLESQFSDVLYGEFAFINTTDAGGADGADTTQFVALGQYRMSAALELGARISYVTGSSDDADLTGFAPSIFLTNYF